MAESARPSENEEYCSNNSSPQRSILGGSVGSQEPEDRDKLEIKALMSQLPDSWLVLDTHGYFDALQQLFEAAFRLRRISIGVDVEPTCSERFGYFRALAKRFQIHELHKTFVAQGLLPGLRYEPKPGIPSSILRVLKPNHSDGKWLSMNKHWRKSALNCPSLRLIQLEMKQQYYRELLMSYVDYLFREETVKQTELIYEFMTEQNGAYEGRRQSESPFKDQEWQELRAQLDRRIAEGFDVPGSKFASMATPVDGLKSLLTSSSAARNIGENYSHDHERRSPKRRGASAVSSSPPTKRACMD